MGSGNLGKYGKAALRAEGKKVCTEGCHEAAWPLHATQRAEFEQQVITELLRLPVDARGPSSLHRTIATVQRAFLGTAIGGTGNLAKYGGRG